MDGVELADVSAPLAMDVTVGATTACGQLLVCTC
jgi:hypothetical protein